MTNEKNTTTSSCGGACDCAKCSCDCAGSCHCQATNCSCGCVSGK